MCKIKLQNYIMIFYESILMNAMSYQMVKEKSESKYDPKQLCLKVYNYDDLFENEALTDSEKSLSDMPPLEGDEETKRGKELKILTPSKLLTRLPILTAQIKAGNNS